MAWWRLRKSLLDFGGYALFAIIENVSNYLRYGFKAEAYVS